MPTERFCVNCKHFGGIQTEECRRTASINPVNGHKFFESCGVERTALYGTCGPAGIHFVPIKNEAQLEFKYEDLYDVPYPDGERI